MSKLLNTYNNLKQQDSEVLYLFKNGAFYLALQEDADFLSNTFNLKITKLNDLCYNPANLKFGVICLNKYGSAIFSPIYVTFEISEIYNCDFIGAVLAS